MKIWLIGAPCYESVLRPRQQFWGNSVQDNIKFYAGRVNNFNNFNNICNILHNCMEKNATVSVGSCVKVIILIIRYLKNKLILRRVAATLCSISFAANQVAAATAAQTPAKAEITSTTSKVVFQFDNMFCSGWIATIKSSLAGYANFQEIIVDIAGHDFRSVFFIAFFYFDC